MSNENIKIIENIISLCESAKIRVEYTSLPDDFVMEELKTSILGLLDEVKLNTSIMKFAKEQFDSMINPNKVAFCKLLIEKFKVGEKRYVSLSQAVHIYNALNLMTAQKQK